MFASSTLGVLLGTVLLISSIPDAVSYTKYGRTCKDIGCMRDEVCVMVEDPCSLYQRDNCGRYPTCEKAHPGGASCASTVCGENEYCKTENGMPTCVKKSTGIGYDSAGVSFVNGYRTSNNDKLDKTTNSASNAANPYANANAPPPEPADPAGGYHHVNSGNNLGYPPYPGNSGSNGGYPPPVGKSVPPIGFPPYPSSNQENRQQNLGYPPYPTQNRMPVPGQPVYPANHGLAPGYQNYPYGNYPNQNRMYPNDVYSGYRKSDSIMQYPSFTIICLASLVALLANRS